MKSSESSDPAASSPPRVWISWIAGVLLFVATALVVLWQNSRLAVLWDLSYTLENSYRISLGDMPYRDFPFVHPPLTFLIQAALIKLTGPVVWHHAVYCAIVGALSTVLTWRIMQKILRGAVGRPRLLSFLLSLPLIPLGVYSIFPHPFYDPDCTVVILLGIWLFQQADLERSPSPSLSPRALLGGTALVIPLFVKQNTGLAFLVSGLGLLLALIVLERLRHRSARRYLFAFAGASVTFAFALLLIHFTAGLRNYWHWTMTFAAQRRTPAFAEMLGIYADKTIILWLGFIVAGVLCLWLNRWGNRVLTVIAALLIAAPFIWPAVYLLRESDSSERADRLLAVWPVVLIASLLIATFTIKRRRGISLILPFLVIGAIHGAFMSQQLWGSTYAIWPLLLILLAINLAELSRYVRSPTVKEGPFGELPSLAVGLLTRSDSRINDRWSWFTIPLISTIALSLLIAGGFYVRSHERLEYASLDDGELKRSTLPRLRGLSTRGDWLPNFEELVRYTENQIPRDQAILILPGEDPFYYATGRRPQFPVLLFDRTVNPYSPDEILNLCRQRNISWVIIKQDLQDEDDQVEQERDRLTEAVEREFEQVESLANYDIYRRIDPNKKSEDDDDDGN